MKLEDAIEYYDNLADECRRKASIERNDYMDLKDEFAECRQLAEWLNELKIVHDEIDDANDNDEIFVGYLRNKMRGVVNDN